MLRWEPSLLAAEPVFANTDLNFRCVRGLHIYVAELHKPSPFMTAAEPFTLCSGFFFYVRIYIYSIYLLEYKHRCVRAAPTTIPRTHAQHLRTYVLRT